MARATTERDSSGKLIRTTDGSFAFSVDMVGYSTNHRKVAEKLASAQTAEDVGEFELMKTLLREAGETELELGIGGTSDD